MNTLNKKINNLKEVINEIIDNQDLIDTKERKEKYGEVFLIDREFQEYYKRAIRFYDTNNFNLSRYIFIVSSMNDISINIYDYFIIYNRNNRRDDYKYQATLLNANNYDETKIKTEIINAILYKKGTKKDFKELDKNLLHIFYRKNQDFFSQANIERLEAAEQLKNF